MRNIEKNRAACKVYYSKNKAVILKKKKDRHPNYAVWHGMIQRCYNSNRSDYKYYGGKGVTVCQEWLDSFDKFNEDMGVRPSMGHTLDRREGGGNYTKDNCRWATRAEQSYNKKSNRFIIYGNVTDTLSGWSRRLNIPLSTLYQKLKKRSIDQLINQ